MKVLHVLDSLSGSGGAERGLVREITRFSPDIGQRVVLLYDRVELVSHLEDHGIPVDVVGLTESKGSRTWPRAMVFMRRIAREFQPDVIQSSLFLGNLVGQLVGRSLRTPVLSNLVLSGNLELLRAYQPSADTLRASALRAIAGWAARSNVVSFRALTEEVKETNARLLGVDPSRVTVIPRGVPDMTQSAPRDRAQLGLPPGRLVMNVGRQSAQKGQTLLLESFAEVAKRVVDAQLVIVGGEGSSSTEVTALVRALGLERRVTMVGYTPQVHQYLAHAAVFVFSSVMEGLGTAVLEAMSYALPIVAFDIPPVREATSDGRFARLVPVGDTQAMALGIISVLESNVDRNLVAREWILRHRCVDVIAAAVEELVISTASKIE